MAKTNLPPVPKTGAPLDEKDKNSVQVAATEKTEALPLWLRVARYAGKNGGGSTATVLAEMEEQGLLSDSDKRQMQQRQAQKQPQQQEAAAAPAATAPVQATARQLQEQTQQELDAYTSSATYEENRKKRNQEILQMAMDNTFSATSSPYAAAQQNRDGGQAPLPYAAAEQNRVGVQAPPVTDAYEEQLKQQLKQHTNQAKAEEDMAVAQADEEELRTWSKEDLAALDSYIIGRDQRDAFLLNPMTDNGYVPELPKNAQRLIEKYGQKRVDELAESLSRSRNAELTEQTAQYAKDAVNSGTGAAVGHNVASVPAAAVGSLTGLMGYLQELGRNTGRYSTLDPNNAGNLLNVYAGNVRGQTAQNIAGDQYDENGQKIADGGIGRQLLSYGYQGVMSAADTYARLLLGGGAAGGATLAATNTFAQTMSEAAAQGATPGQATLLAVTKAGIEALSEKLPLEELVKTAGAGKQTAMQIAKNALAQAGIEIAEEEVSLFGSVLAEAAILQEKSAYKDKSAEELLMEAAETAIVSGFAGGVSSAGASAVGNLTASDSPTVQAQEEQTPQQRTEQAMEELAAQWGQEAPKAEPAQKTEAERHWDNAYEMTMGEGQQKTAASKETTVNVKSAGTALTEQNKEKNTLAYTLASNLDSVRDMAPVSQLTGTELNDRSMKLSDQIRSFFKSLGNKVTRNGFGEVELGEYGVGGTLNHKPINRAKAVSIAAVPDVIKNGRQISYDPNWKGRGYESFTFAAPATVGETTVYVAAVVNKRPDNKFYLSEMVDSEGNYVRIEESPSGNSKNGLPMGPENQQGRDYAGPEELSEGSNPSADAEPMPLPENIVPRQGEEVNGNFDEGRARSVDTLEASATEEQPGIKGTGAAERGFTPKQALINEYGYIPEGENPVRPDQLPASTDGTDRVSRTARTALEARVTPDEFVPLIENEAVRGGFSFIPIHNDDTVQTAIQDISREGWQTARANWTANVRAGATSPEITATGALLYNHAVNAGDSREAMEILMDYQMAVRNTARALQAARILKTLTPSDRLWMIRRSVEAMVRDMNLDTPVTIDETLAQNYQNAATQEEADEILDQIAEDVARQIPATGMEAFTALRYLNMLGNLRTQVRNVAGNVGSKLVYGVKDKIGAGIEAAVSCLTGGRIERTKAFATDRATRQAAVADYDQVRDWILGGGRYNDRPTESEDFARRVQDRRRLLPRGLEEYRRATEWAMDAGDEIFARSAYARALAGYLNARGIRTDNLDSVNPEVMDRAREYAVRQAQEQTFRDNNEISDFVGGILRGRNTPAWARVIGEGILPFRKTPANVLVRAEEFSPLGVINSTVNTIRAARGEINGAELVDSWAKTLTGSALFALGMALYDFGVLSGGPDEDKEKDAFDKLNGTQDYALNITVGGKTYSYTIDWATPAAMPLFLGAQMQKLFSQEEDLQWSDYEKVITAVGDPLIQMSMLQGVNDTLENIRYTDNNLGQFFINAAVNYMTQGLTNTLLGQIERSTEGTRQTTYIDEDSAVPKWLQRQLGKVSQKIPGWDYQQTDYINARGETEAQRTDLLGWIYNLISPGYVDKVEVDQVSEELYRLHETGASESNVFLTSPDTTLNYTDEDGVSHKDYHLSVEEADTLKRVTGQTSVQLLNKLFETETYKAMTDQQKAKVVEYAYDYAREKGRAEALTGYKGMTGWMQGIEGKETDTILNKAITNAFTDAFDTLEENPEATIAALDQAASLLTEGPKQANFANAAGGRVKYFLTAHSAGIDTADFVALYQQFRSIDGNTDLSTSEKAQEWSYKLEKAREAGTITAKQRDTLKNSMVYYQMFPAGTDKFDQLTESGISADKALKIGDLLAGIVPQEGYTNVRDVQKAEAIAGADLSDAEMENALRAYLPDSQDENLDLMLEMGYSPEDYVTAYSIYANESGAGKKARIIQKIQEEFGVSRATATEIYNIYG